MKPYSDFWRAEESADAHQVNMSEGNAPGAAQVLASMRDVTPSKEPPKKEIGSGEHNKHATEDKQATNVLVTDPGAGNAVSINVKTNADNATFAVLKNVVVAEASEGAEESAGAYPDAGAGNTASINKSTNGDNAKSTVLKVAKTVKASEGAEEFDKNEIGAGDKNNLAKEDQTPANVLATGETETERDATAAKPKLSLQQRTDAEVEAETLTAGLHLKWFFAKHKKQGWIRMKLLEPNLFEYRVLTFKQKPKPHPMCKDPDRKKVTVEYEQEYVAHGDEQMATVPHIWKEDVAGTVACLLVPACACLNLPVSVCACVCLPVSACV